MRQQARRYQCAAIALIALLGGGCALLPAATVATSLATSTGTHIVLDRAFGESKPKRDARAAFERAPPCASMTHGVQNGRIVTMVNDIAWFDAADSRGQRVMIDYRIDNRSDSDVIVTPRRLTVTDAAGKQTNATDEAGGNPANGPIPAGAAVLGAGDSWPMVSIFQVPPGEYALMVPNGRLQSDLAPTWVDGCRFPGPVAALRSG